MTHVVMCLFFTARVTHLSRCGFQWFMVSQLSSFSSKIQYLHVYKPHFFDKNFLSKIGVRLIHGIL
jgi:hypothetical protein